MLPKTKEQEKTENKRLAKIRKFVTNSDWIISDERLPKIRCFVWALRKGKLECFEYCPKKKMFRDFAMFGDKTFLFWATHWQEYYPLDLEESVELEVLSAD